MTARWVLVALGVACGSPGGEVRDERCAAYEHDAEALAYCHYLQGAEAHSLAEATRLCDAAGDWSARCRTTWVGRHPRGPTRDELLSFCEDDACRFDVLDAHLTSDIDAEVARCTDYTPAYRDACIDHALIAWSQALPDQAELGRMAVRTDIEPRRLGQALGEVVLCADGRSCAGPAEVAHRCEAVVRRADRSVCGGTPPPPPTGSAPRPARSGPR